MPSFGLFPYINTGATKVEIDGTVYTMDEDTVLRNEVGVIFYVGASAIDGNLAIDDQVFDIVAKDGVISSLKVKAAVADKAAAAVIKLINELPATTAADFATKVAAARAAYDALDNNTAYDPANPAGTPQKALVTNLDELEAAEAVVQEAEKAAKAKEDADKFKDDHKAILAKTVDTVAVSDKENIEEALTAYDGLSAEAKALLTAEKELLDSLKVAVEKIELLNTINNNLTKESPLQDAFEKLGSSKYDALSNGEKIEVVKLFTVKARSSFDTLADVVTALEADIEERILYLDGINNAKTTLDMQEELQAIADLIWPEDNITITAAHANAVLEAMPAGGYDLVQDIVDIIENL